MNENEYESQLGFDFLYYDDGYSYDDLYYIVDAALADAGCTLTEMHCFNIDNDHGFSYLDLADDEHIDSCTVKFTRPELFDFSVYDEELISNTLFREFGYAGCEVLGDVMFGDDA